MTTHVLPLSGAWDDGSERRAEAFRVLFDAHFDRLYWYAWRLLNSEEDAADLVQDVFLAVWRKQPPMAQPLNYLYEMVRNACYSQVKHRRVVDRYLVGQRLAEPEVTATPEEEWEHREHAAALQRALDDLPPRQRQVLRLRWERHLSYAEVAQELGIAPKTVGMHLCRALAHLRARLPGMLQ